MMKVVDVTLLYPVAAELIRRYGGGLLDAGDDFGEKLLDKGADAIAASAVGALISWLKTRSRSPKELEARAQAAIDSPTDEAKLAALASTIADAVGGDVEELRALVHAASQAASVQVASIRFGGVKSAVYVEGGGNAMIGRLDVDIQ